MSPKILAFSGSHRDGACNGMLWNVAVAGAVAAGAGGEGLNLWALGAKMVHVTAKLGG